MRIRIIRYTIWVMFVIIAADIVYLQVLRGQYYHRLSTHNRIRVVPSEGGRGRILDRQGIVLADNRISFDVMVIPQEIRHFDELFGMLSYVLEVERERLVRQYKQKKFTPFAPVIVAEDITRKQLFVLEEKKFKFPSLIIQKNYRRYYPFRETGAHVLGYVGKISRARIQKLKDYGYSARSIIGYSGVEEYYDADLRGEAGGQQIEVNSQGHQVRLLGLKEPQFGEDLVLTVDHRIQLIAQNALKDNSGAIVVMDMKNGEILGMVSSPSYDPNVFIESGKQDRTAELFSDEAAPMLNRSIKGIYPPGSVFKIPIALAALNLTKVAISETFHCPGYYKMGRRRIRCAHTHGDQNLIEGIAHSCNVFFINVGLRLGSDLIAKYARLLGLGQLTQIDLPFEEAGQIPSKKQRRIVYNRQWYKGDTANLSIGQGEVLTTPIQIVRMMATVATDGEMVQPHVVRTADLKKNKRFFPHRKVRINKGAFDKVKEGLYGVVHDLSGTAQMLNIEGLEISGKTGTAQSKAGKMHHAWFVGFTKDTDDDVAFCVFLEYGGSSYYAVRVAKKILTEMKKANII